MNSRILFASLTALSMAGGAGRRAAAQSAPAQSAPAALYVNDGATTGDVFTGAPGSDATGDGSAAAPFATVARALTQAGPATQTVFIDAGIYTERVVLNLPVSLQGAGTATARPGSATVFDGGLVASPTQTSEAGLLIAANGRRNVPLTVADITFQAYDFGIQATGAAPQAHVLLEDVETVHNRRQGIFWVSLNGVQDLTFRRVRAAYTAETGNTNANGAGRGLYLTNGHKTDILIEDGVFELNRRAGVDINDGSVSGLIVRNNVFSQNIGGGLIVLGAAGARDSRGTFTSFAALIEGNALRNNASNGMELKSCTGSGRGSGVGSFVVRRNYIARTPGAPTNLTEDNAGVAFIDRDRSVIGSGGGLTGDLVTGGAFVEGNTVRGYLSDATSSRYNINGFGLVLEGAQNKVFGNVVAQCQRGVQVQDHAMNSGSFTPFYDASRNGLVVSSGDSIRGNRLDSCATAIRTVNLTNPVDASLNWLGATTATAVRGAAGTGGLIVTLGGPASSYAERSAFAPTGLIDYSPFLHTPVDAAPAPGFQPAIDYLNVDHYSPQSAAAGPLAEGVALVAENGTLNLEAAGYDESISIAKSLALTNTGATFLRGLALNGADKVLTLKAPLTLTGSLTLAEGLVHTSSTGLLTLAARATATAGTATSYVDGPLRKVGQQAFVFPLGKDGQWARLGISAPADSATAFTAEYVAAYATRPPAAPLSEASQVEHWTLTSDSAASAVRVRLYWESAIRSGIDDFSSDLQVAAFNGTEWQTAGNGGLNGSLQAGSVESAQPVGGFAAYTLGSLSPTVNPLHLQLVAFYAVQPRPGTAHLTWMFNDETNAYGYAVEQWTNTGNWQQIGFVPSQGLTAQARTYTYQDQRAQSPGLAYYRLRQTNAAGQVRYSAIASVLLTSSPLATTPAASADQFSFFPNPTHDRVTLVLPAAVRGEVVALLTDLSGRWVYSQVLRAGVAPEVQLPAGLPGGIYLLQVQAAGFAGRPQRMVIQ